jgi:NodT family efflux transporter outer membrane factor (OMF) lipoprotein
MFRFEDLMHSIPLRRLLLPAALGAASLLTACASFDGIAPGAHAIDQVALAIPDSMNQTNAAWPQDGWWRAYRDSQLDRLIEQALTNSPDLATAQVRIARAEAGVQLMRSRSRPQFNGTVNAGYGRFSENAEIPPPPIGPGGEYASQGRVAFNASVDLDFWGKNAALIKSAGAQVEAAGFDRDAARLALTTSIARTYVQLALDYAQQDVLQAIQRQQQAIHDLTALRVKHGLDTDIELKQSASNVATARLNLTQLATEIEAIRLQLAMLSGAMPTAAADITRPVLTDVPFSVPATLPLDLLGRRPELAAQRARIKATVGDIEAAQTQFYPNINLSALVGFQAIGLDQLLKAGSFTNSIGPAISLPLFSSKGLRASYAIVTSDVDAAIHQYNQAVLAAARDVAEQLTRIASLSEEAGATRAALVAAEAAHHSALLRYRAGLSTRLPVLQVETQLLAQQRATVELQARQRTLQVALVRALGGGFNEAGHAATALPH